ncbi:MAG: calcium/proton exchanger [Candidatus Eisenbacteria bacterium]|nr:calcium/proton exchanger [Candidatus Eisenbacteria bacterium]
MNARTATTARPPFLAPDRWLQLLLVFVIVAPLAELLHWSPLAVFAFSALAIVPLAGLMGEATEKLASRLGEGVGGLLNATFGNAAELIIALVALQRGLYDVVKASLTGSIIGNSLLVLGLAMVAGGARREKQTFDRSAAAASSTLLLLAAIALVVPAAFHFVNQGAIESGRLSMARETALERDLSLEISVVLIVSYVLSLFFTLRTHKHLYTGGAADQAHAPVNVGRAVATLVVATALIAWMSELLVGAVEAASHALGLTEVFVGVIVVAVIGNAAEHSTAVLVAMKNKMDLALNIAIGSSIQIALFVAPVLVFVSYFMPHGPMNLRFSPFEVLAVITATFIVNMVAADGESNWLEGAMLLAVYVVLGLAFYFLP